MIPRATTSEESSPLSLANPAIWFWFVLSAAVIASRLCHCGLLWSDEDYHLAAAIQALHGKIPYRDFFYDKPILNLAFYWIAAKMGLTPPQAAFLVFLHDTDASSVSELSKQWNISQSVATRMIDRLVEKNMITRERDGEDRRIVHALLTEKGEMFVKKVCAQRDETIREIFAVLDEKERSLFLNLLEKIDERYE